jgi:predicted HNH restriction endonuclease
MARIHHRHRDRVLQVWGCCCGLCKQYQGYNPDTEIHHIKPQREGGTDTDDNLIPLCLLCHTMVRKGQIVFDRNKLLSELKILLDKRR